MLRGNSHADVWISVQISIAPNYDDEEEEEEEEEEVDPCIEWAPCPCCDPNNTLGYVCPNPIQDRIQLTGDDYSDEYRGHVKCGLCQNVVPTGWKPFECSKCRIHVCGSMFDCLPAHVDPQYGVQRVVPYAGVYLALCLIAELS